MSDAILQFEIDRERWADSKPAFNGSFDETPHRRLYNMVKTAACDTLNNGGTFVLVVSPTKITMVQRTTTEDLDEAHDPA